VAAEPALRIEQVGFRYPARRGRRGRDALDGISLTVAAGSFTAMLGPNGSGKSTLLRIVSGLLEPATGSVRVFGAADRRRRRERLGVVFQSPSLDPHLGVAANLRDHGRLHGLGRRAARDRAAAALRQAGLEDRADAPVKTLSGGLARRVDLARATLPEPRLLLLDEPTTGLDPVARADYLETLDRRRRETGITVVMSTHLTDEADRADRAVLLDHGRIVADDAPAALRAGLGRRRVTVTDATWRPPGDDAWHRSAAGWTTALADAPDEAARTLRELTDAGVPFTVAPPTLADAFEALTGSPLELDAEDEA
jgi:ABC-2 type transport system ATP-binding protein